MSDRSLQILLTVALLCAAGVIWPLLKSWLGKHGFHYRSMKEQREHEERDK